MKTYYRVLVESRKNKDVYFCFKTEYNTFKQAYNAFKRQINKFKRVNLVYSIVKINQYFSTGFNVRNENVLSSNNNLFNK